MQFDKEIVFAPYNEHDMVEIVMKRLGKNVGVVERNALAYASKKVAKENGDARYMLEIMSSAVTQCKSSMTEVELKKVSDHMSTIKLKHILKALKESGRTPYAKIIADLPQSQKVVLCIAMTLSQVSPAWKTITFAQLRLYCAEATNQEVLGQLSADSLHSIVSNLEDAGLLNIGEDNSPFRCHKDDNPYDWRLRLGAQLEDVDCALGETLLQQPFYKRLADYVRNSNKDNRQGCD